MEGGVQYDYLMNSIDIQEFIRLKKMVEKLSKKQEKKLKGR